MLIGSTIKELAEPISLGYEVVGYPGCQVQLPRPIEVVRQILQNHGDVSLSLIDVKLICEKEPEHIAMFQEYQDSVIFE